METNIIFLVSVILSIITIKTIDNLKIFINKKKEEIVYKRLNYLKNLDAQGIIKKEIFSLDEEDEKKVEIQTSTFLKKTEIILYNKKYTDKTSWFVLEDEILWILGKKKNYLIQLNGKILKEEIGG